MMNPDYHFRRVRELLDEYEPSRERSLAQTKLDECELWLTRCTPTAEAVHRDQRARLPGERDPGLAEVGRDPQTGQLRKFGDGDQ